MRSTATITSVIVCILFAGAAHSGGPTPGQNDSSKTNFGQSQGTDAVQQSAEAEFKVLMVATGSKGWHAVRYHQATGTAWKMRHHAWVRLKELNGHQPSPGTYEVQVIKTEQGRFAALRMDVNTGRSWHLDEETWLPIADEVDPAGTSNRETESQPRPEKKRKRFKKKKADPAEEVE